jgi:MurNAc alpha-1-phosphate uridylyltransferase
MLLAAGRGERMGELTDTCPKPLLEVAGKPLLFHHIERLRDAGFRDIVINTAYLGEQIRDAVGDGARWQVSIRCTTEPRRLETAGGIINALPLLGDEPFLVVNSDVWCDYPLQALQKPLHGQAHLVLVTNPDHNPDGDFVLDPETGKVASPGTAGNADVPALTFSGISVLSPSLFAGIAPGKRPLAPLLRETMAAGRVTGEQYEGQWVDVGTPERLAQVATLFNEAMGNSGFRSKSCR